MQTNLKCPGNRLWLHGDHEGWDREEGEIKHKDTKIWGLKVGAIDVFPAVTVVLRVTKIYLNMYNLFYAILLTQGFSKTFIIIA